MRIALSITGITILALLAFACGTASGLVLDEGSGVGAEQAPEYREIRPASPGEILGVENSSADHKSANLYSKGEKLREWSVIDLGYDDSWVANIPDVVGGYKVIDITTPKTTACSNSPLISFLAMQESMDEFLENPPDIREMRSMLLSIPGVPSDIMMSFAGSEIDESEKAANLARWNASSIRRGCIILGDPDP